MVNIYPKHGKLFIYNKKFFNENRLEADDQQYHPISIIELLLPNGILQPAIWDHPKP